jgi:hypothetical protein
MSTTPPARRTGRRRAAVGLVLAGSLVLAACGDDESSDAEPTTAPADTGTADTEPASTEPASTEPASTDGAATGPLAGVCPDPVVIQTDWFPESEHGALYQLVGDDPEIDAGGKIVSGPMVLTGGAPAGVNVEIRSGGPAIGFQPVSAQLYADPGITIGYVSTDEATLNADELPTVAVVAPLEKNPQIIMWDPETYPDVTSIADLGELGVTINVFSGGTFIDVFVNEGVLTQDQIDPSYDGSPARFIAEAGAIAQQGFASESPFSYEQVYEEWARPVAFELIHDAGLEVYSQPLAVRAGDLEELRPCLELLVPAVQQAAVDFVTDPAETNALIVEVVETFDDFWVYPAELAEFSVATMLELELIANGPDATLGNFVEDRVQGVIDQMTAAGMGVPEGLTAADIVTNEFIDDSIGLPG